MDLNYHLSAGLRRADNSLRQNVRTVHIMQHNAKWSEGLIVCKEVVQVLQIALSNTLRAFHLNRQ